MKAWREEEGLGRLKPGEMAHGTSNGSEVLILNVDGFHHAFFNRCGHMSAPLDMGVFKSGVIKWPLHNAVFGAHTGVARGQPRLGGEGMDMSKLPKDFVERLMSTMPIMERIACNPLTPLPLELHEGKIRVWV
jgi:nitrite reductase/ring-hydroxylating ferredoxin subunit